MSGFRTRLLPAALGARLEAPSALRSVLGNIGWHSGDHVFRAGVGLLLGVWTARYLGPDRFGLLSYALAFAALVAPLGTLGLDDVAVRNLVRAPAQRDETLGTAFVLKLAGGVVSFLAATAGVVVLRPGDALSQRLVAVVAAGSLFQALHASELWFHSQVQARYSVVAKNVAFTLCAAARAVLILTGAPLVAFAWVSTAEVAAGGAALAVAYRSRGHRLRDWRVTAESARSLLRDSWPVLLACLVINAYLRVDQVLLGQIAGSRAVGVYSVAVRLAEAWLFVSSAVYWSVLPSVVKAKEAGEELFYERLQKYYNLMALAGYAVAVPTTLLSRWLVTTLFGDAYAEAAPMLAVLAWANLFIYLEGARSAFFNAMNWYRLYFVTLALGALTNVALNLWWIPRWGGLGAAAASCVSYWVAAHGSCFLFRRLRRTGVMLARALVWPRVW